nr:MAG TPA: hypothetical protein [Caudoviricetes sp.]
MSLQINFIPIVYSIFWYGNTLNRRITIFCKNFSIFSY